MRYESSRQTTKLISTEFAFCLEKIDILLGSQVCGLVRICGHCPRLHPMLTLLGASLPPKGTP